MSEHRRLATIAVAALVVGLAAAASIAAPPAAVGRGSIETAIHAAAGYLNRSVRADGSFVYRTSLDPAAEVEPRYNLLRHAGAIYALAQYERRHPSAATRETLARAASYLERVGIEAVPEGEGLLAVWTRAEIVGTETPLRAKLGGAGLALVAFLAAREVGASAVDLEVLRGLARFLLFMQKPDGSFHSLYIPAQGGRTDEWTSLYYPGEAALGLVMLYEVDRDPAWLASAARALGYLARARAGKNVRDIEPDHWALLATARLLPLLDQAPAVVARDALVHHAASIAESILAPLPPVDTAAAVAAAGLVGDFRTCPTATRVEGLIAAWSFLPESHRHLRERIVAAVRPAIGFLMGAQVVSGEAAGAIPHAYRGRPPRGADAEVRIDYVQHTLSALLGGAELVD